MHTLPRVALPLGAILIAILMLFGLGALAPANAQGTGGIAGTLRDETGAVLPGVTVEATSPALIEGTKSAVSDGAGQYRIVDLQPGVYTVTFTLTGFSTLKRDGIELTSAFTATVHAILKTGGVEETITVTGASPLVDVQNVRQQAVLTRELLEAIPSGGSFQHVVNLVPGINRTGARQDVGGTSGTVIQTFTVHGSDSRDQQMMINGMPLATNISTGEAVTPLIQMEQSIQEYNFETSGKMGESHQGGLQINIVTREGGNSFRGGFSVNFSNGDLQSDNFTEELKVAGLPTPNYLKEIWSINPSFGGPIVRNRFWFFATAQRAVTDTYQAGLFENSNIKSVFYQADATKQAVNDQWDGAGATRLTWLATQKNRVSGYYEYNSWCTCHFNISPTRSPEATTRFNTRNHIAQAFLTSTVTNRLLVEAGVSLNAVNVSQGYQEGVSEIPITENGSVPGIRTGMTYRAACCGTTATPYGIYQNPSRAWAARGAVSYVTGSHAAKVGVDFRRNKGDRVNSFIGDQSWVFLNQVPNQVTYYATPYNPIAIMPSLGVYAQDQWRTGRWTFNGALRFDWFEGYVPEQTVEPVRWVPRTLHYDRVDVANWEDLNPRLGVAYDLFGTGRTALKFFTGRYIPNTGVDLINEQNPVIVNGLQRRQWTDDGDFVPEGDPTNPEANGELGVTSNRAFGSAGRVAQRIDPEYGTGWGVRSHNWEVSAQIQHELRPGVGVSGGYFRRWFRNIQIADNLAVGPSDYDEYCVTAPLDPRLPDGGGERICGLYDIDPALSGVSDTIVTSASKYGNQERQWDGFDINVNARSAGGWLVQGGLSSGTTMTDNCDVVTKTDNPNTRFCYTETPMLTNVRLNAAVPLPWKLQASAAYQSNPGSAITASYTARNAEIRPSLGRNLAAGANATATVPLVEPGTMYGERANQLDLRLAKHFAIRTGRLQATIDLYNALNANPILSQSNAYGTNGATWLAPSLILEGRLLKFGVRMDF